MFGIGLPEMIVILAVALIVVGPEKLPDMARSLAKGVMELKRTLNQVKTSLAEEEKLLDSVQSDLRKTTAEIGNDRGEGPSRVGYGSGAGSGEGEVQDGDIIDVVGEELPEDASAPLKADSRKPAAKGEGAAQEGQEGEGVPAESQPAASGR